MFINRKNELDSLMDVSGSPRAELVLIYGRRRVGKSRLLIEFVRKTNALYLLADLSKNILDILSQQVGNEFVKFNTWEDFFEFIYKSKYKIIIIDEFQYLYHINKAWPSILQRWWEKIKATDKKIILCGSIISTIYKISKGYGSALYGRKTMEMEILPLKFKHIKDFFPKYNLSEIIQIYSLVGGIPRYLEEFDTELSVMENIKKKILNKTSFLYNEPINLLFEEFRDPAPYVAILVSITQGYMKFAEIATVCGIESNKLPKYLMILERVGLIEKEVPVTEKKIRVRTTRYNLRDNFYRFWFRFVFRNKSMIEQGFEQKVFESIKRDFNTYLGVCFEKICKEFIIDIQPIDISKIGRWWYKDREIDIVAFNEDSKEILFAECKWQDNVNAERIIQELKEKSRYVDWCKKNRKEYYAIIAKSFKRKIKEPNLLLFDLKDIESFIKKK